VLSAYRGVKLGMVRWEGERFQRRDEGRGYGRLSRMHGSVGAGEKFEDWVALSLKRGLL
jgi:hypothetical protein